MWKEKFKKDVPSWINGIITRMQIKKEKQPQIYQSAIVAS